MAGYHASVETRRTPDETFAYMADFVNAREWDPGVEQAERRGTGPIGTGSEFSLQYRMLGRTIALLYRIVEYDAPRTVVLVCETGTMSLRDRIEVAPAGTGSRITYDATVTLKGPLKLADPLLQVGFTRSADRALDGLRGVMSG